LGKGGGLYFDFNEMDMAWQIYLYTRRYYHLPKDNFPIGIVVGTFELDARFWYDRNVVGRLLAVTMGASQEVNADDGNELYGLYHTACKGVGFEDALCSHYGLPFVSWKEYKAKWTDVWTMWKKRICDRLTTSYDELTYNSPNRRSSSFPEGNTLQSFWDEFGITKNKTIVDLESNYKFSALQQIPDLAALMNRLVSKSGIVMDLTLPNQHEQILGPKSTLLEQIYALGFNLIQLRLANDYNIGYTPGALPHAVVQDATSRRPAQHSHGSQTQHVRPSIKQIKESLVAMATSRVSFQATHRFWMCIVTDSFWVMCRILVSCQRLLFRPMRVDCIMLASTFLALLLRAGEARVSKTLLILATQRLHTASFEKWKRLQLVE
jgi:hypothetical protein